MPHSETTYPPDTFAPLVGLAAQHPAAAVTAASAGLVLAVGLAWALKRTITALRGTVARHNGADVLTYAAASIATAVSAQGMWRFFRDVLEFEVFLRIGVFAFLEIAVLASAVRARRSIREKRGAGIDGAAVWVLTLLTGTLSALHATSFAEALFRLVAPLVAAWLWERGMGAERLRLTGRTGIHWRITPERVLVRLGLAEATDRTAEQAAADRRIARLALATLLVRTQRAAGVTGWRARWSSTRLAAAMQRAVTHTDLASNTELQALLLAKVSALSGSDALVAGVYSPPWAQMQPAPVAVSSVAAPVAAPVAPVCRRSDAIRPPAAVTATPTDPQPLTAPAEPHQETPEEPQAPKGQPDRERREWTEEQILDELRELEEIPSQRAIQRTYRVGQPKAKSVHDRETTRREANDIQRVSLEKTKINLRRAGEQPTVQHFEYTPMQQS